MADLIRPVPTPGELARPRPAPPRPATSRPYDRREWETAVQSGALFAHGRLLAFVLAHHGGTDGYLPAGGIQYIPNLARLTGLTARRLKLALRELHDAGLIWRPPSPEGTQSRQCRPITLTLPAAAADRSEPPHTGEAS